MKYADYVRIAPEVKSALRVVDDKLCLGGLTYGQDYSVTLLAGFPSADDSKLADERKVELALGPRPAVITLPGKGFVLPRGTAAGLPITTVNVAKLALSVYRVNSAASTSSSTATTRASPPLSRRPSSTRCANG